MTCNLDNILFNLADMTVEGWLTYETSICLDLGCLHKTINEECLIEKLRQVLSTDITKLTIRKVTYPYVICEIQCRNGKSILGIVDASNCFTIKKAEEIFSNLIEAVSTELSNWLSSVGKGKIEEIMLNNLRSVKSIDIYVYGSKYLPEPGQVLVKVRLVGLVSIPVEMYFQREVVEDLYKLKEYLVKKTGVKEGLAIDEVYPWNRTVSVHLFGVENLRKLVKVPKKFSSLIERLAFAKIYKLCVYGPLERSLLSCLEKVEELLHEMASSFLRQLLENVLIISLEERKIEKLLNMCCRSENTI